MTSYSDIQLTRFGQALARGSMGGSDTAFRLSLIWATADREGREYIVRRFEDEVARRDPELAYSLIKKLAY